MSRPAEDDNGRAARNNRATCERHDRAGEFVIRNFLLTARAQGLTPAWPAGVPPAGDDWLLAGHVVVGWPNGATMGGSVGAHLPGQSTSTIGTSPRPTWWPPRLVELRREWFIAGRNKYVTENRTVKLANLKTSFTPTNALSGSRTHVRKSTDKLPQTRHTFRTRFTRHSPAERKRVGPSIAVRGGRQAPACGSSLSATVIADRVNLPAALHNSD
jgi:hypothetical protein